MGRRASAEARRWWRQRTWRRLSGLLAPLASCQTGIDSRHCFNLRPFHHYHCRVFSTSGVGGHRSPDRPINPRMDADRIAPTAALVEHACVALEQLEHGASAAITRARDGVSSGRRNRRNQTGSRASSSLAGYHHHLGVPLLAWAMDGMAGAPSEWIPCFYKWPEPLLLHSDGRTRRPPGSRNYGSSVCRGDFALAKQN